jgi:hypothetical protein
VRISCALLERQARLGHVQIQDGGAGVDSGPRLEAHAQDARVDRAREHVLDRGHDRARRAQRRFDGSGLDDGGSDLVAGQGRAQELGPEPEEGDAGGERERAEAGLAEPAPAGHA